MACPGGGTKAPDRLNLLLVTVDSLRADRLGFSGHAAAQTPTMDALAARGVRFTSAWTPVPEATPAAASIMTGQYPPAHGLRSAFPSPAGARTELAATATTLAESLKSQGYATGASVGALLLHEKYGLAQGFDRYLTSFSDAARPSLIPEAGYPAQRVVDAALEYLEGAKSGPFFLWINFQDPHFFYAPPEPFASRFSATPYDGEIAYVDRELGRLLERLKGWGLQERTVVVLAGTNGEGLGDEGEEYHGVALQAATMRVPLIIVAPGRAGLMQGSSIDSDASLVDITPTVLDLLGLPALMGIDGVSLASGRTPERKLYMESSLGVSLMGWPGARGAVASGLIQVTPGVDQPGAAAMDPATAALIEAAGFPSRAAQRRPVGRDQLLSVANDALKGDRSLRRRQLQAAWLLFEGVLREDPDNYIGLLDTALLSGSRGDRVEARRRLERARDLYPMAAEVYHQMGHLTMAEQPERGSDTAARLFEIACKLDPLNEEALYDAACAYSVRGDGDRALAALERAIAAGFRDFKWMAGDSDLDSIRSNPRFDIITGGKARKEAPTAAPAASR